MLGDQSTKIHARSISVQKKSKRLLKEAPQNYTRYDTETNIKGMDREIEYHTPLPFFFWYRLPSGYLDEFWD
ncbi:hypothetical protein EO95_03785 [Methanosarcina sp. 1.H.T.1A.1]|uniref:hypothetical protein n=1 Tax=Methanosarcina sp. 1.H.T.1A.1 TaxID=1483602 RepID=UPI000621E21D|nr:hypothetical protein [Methanosarcina sp. 1.H.T.1A.1]KKH96881.1 hypothetical protein EO95_03785 [Methanosarcina sp. 1.H.T.1A.1]